MRLRSSAMARCLWESTCLDWVRCAGYIPCARPGPSGSQPFDSLFELQNISIPDPGQDSRLTLATLPYSSGTTGLPKGVMLSHYNLVANVYQTLIPGELGAIAEDDVMLCFLPLYHIYGMTVGLNLSLIRGCTLVLMARFDCEKSLQIYLGRRHHPDVVRAAQRCWPIARPPSKEHFRKAIACGGSSRAPRRWRRNWRADSQQVRASRFARVME